MADTITISITIPNQLEDDLQKEADLKGISRSRHIGNILLERQENKEPPNDCDFNSNGQYKKYNTPCVADQTNAETCEGYSK